MFTNSKKICLAACLLFSLHLISHSNFTVTQYTANGERDFLNEIGGENFWSSYMGLFSSEETKVAYLARAYEEALGLFGVALETLEPDLVIIQGLPFALGYSPQSGQNSKQFAFVKEAMRLHVDFIGSDMEIEEKRQCLFDYGYTAEDVFYYEFTESAVCKSTPVLEQDIQKEFDAFCKAEEKDFSFEEYTAWLEKHIENFEFNMFVDQELVAPISNSHFIHKMASVLSIKEDQHILKVIEISKEKYNNIVVVSARSRFFTQYLGLVEMLGEAQFCLNKSELKEAASR